MHDQNIYDNPSFFNEYFSLRKKDANYNNLLEQPAMAKIMPDLKDKTVLDLGCGYGNNCAEFIRQGAKRVVGIDISEKMLKIARSENSDEKIEYIHMSMSDIGSIDEKFDLVYSSLAFHYVNDFSKLISDIFGLLNPNGHLLYSQEHPIITATVDGRGHFNYDKEGNPVSYTFSNYNQMGKRVIHWIVDGVIKYHRSMGEIITTIAKSGFILEELCEPIPEEWAIKKLPSLAKEFLKPNFLILKAYKQ